tara:strand:- start:71 stop:277 length:207 start_codon:yes stop_codon:yes gene_type:complete
MPKPGKNILNSARACAYTNNREPYLHGNAFSRFVLSGLNYKFKWSDIIADYSDDSTRVVDVFEGIINR